MKVLVTGFGGWGNDHINPAFELMKYFKEREIDGAEIFVKELPVDTKQTSISLVKHLDEITPDIHIALGSAPGRSVICLERIAINVLDFPIPDNVGNQPVDEQIALDGPLAYYSTIPIKAIVKELKNNGIPSKVSNTASTYICNQTMYTSLHFAATKNNALKSGFIHLPILPEQEESLLRGIPSMALEVQAKAVELAIKVAMTTEQDLKIAGTCLS